MSEVKTEFQRLYRLHIKRACEKNDWTLEQLSKKLGKSRQIVDAYGRVKKACSHDFLQVFIKELALPHEEAKTLEREWILDRLLFGKYGPVFEVFVNACRANLTPRQFESLVNECVRTYQSHVASEDD